MSTTTKRRSRPPQTGLPDRVAKASAIALVGAVLLVLLLGAVLRAPSGVAEERAIAEWPASAPPFEDAPVVREPEALPEAPARATPEPTRTPEARSEPALGDLGRRAQRDLDRLSASGADWTAQLAVLCDASSVESLTRSFGTKGGFHVLPAFHAGRSCFAICWGGYANADDAREARDLPAGLRGLTPRPLPKRTSELLGAVR